MTTGLAPRARTAIVTITLAAVLIVAIALTVDVREVAAAFLVAYVAAVSTALGVLAMTLIAHLTTAVWFRPFRPHAELVLTALPALAAIGVILLIAMPVLFPWVGVATQARAFLNAPFFIVRWVVYWGSWIAISESLLAAQRRGARGDIALAQRRFRRVASAGLIVLALTMTFAAFDWMMSLTPEWQSSIYGLYWFAGGMLSGLALLAVLASVRRGVVPEAPPTRDDTRALGKLMMTFVLFWLYIGFAQYIVIWSADLPNEVTWYAARTHGGWGALAVLLVFGNFVLPFCLLLSGAARRSPLMLAVLGGALLGLHYLDTFWVVVPGVAPVRWWTAVVSAAVLTLMCGLTALLLTLRHRRLAARTLRAVEPQRPSAGIRG